MLYRDAVPCEVDAAQNALINVCGRGSAVALLSGRLHAVRTKLVSSATGRMHGLAPKKRRVGVQKFC